MSDRRPHHAPAPGGLASGLPRRFEALAAEQPRAMAVVYGEWRLTYRDVNAAANRLAHRLRALGVARDVRVGLCLDRGPDLLVAILAVLKAGGAYVPLDPHWPADRLRRMRAAADPAVIVTRTAWLGLLPDHAGAALDLDRDQQAIGAESHANPEVALVPEQLCYVLFTSGSTGEPKGVPVTHGNLANLFPPLAAALRFGPDDVWTWFHSTSFGFSVWELWGALLHGGCLVIVPEHIRKDPAALGELIADEGVTVFSQTPSAFRRVLHDARFHAAVAGSALRYLALSGEAIRRDDIAGWLERGHRAQLVSTYAITETGGQLTLRVYGDGDASEAGARNLGRPLDGRHVLVLDPAGRPVEAGTPGELWVGGACVTPGYLGADELAAGRFTEHAVPGAGVLRGYRTGDRVRLLTDGALEYLGRVDAQLKFRGYRIEPGDIETALREHPAVRDAAVVLRPDPAGNLRLTGFVVPATVAPTSPPAIAGESLEFWPSLGAYGIYDPWLYGLMNAEPVRLAAYRAAFAVAVPGKVVLDIGTGEDAVLARLCAEAGAAHVYAIEVLEAVAQRAAALIRSLGLEERITVLHGDIANLVLPQPVDVCTQGIVGNIGSADGIAAIWNSAQRHFAPDCVPVPVHCVTRIAAVELPAATRAAPGFGPLAIDYARRVFTAVGQAFDLRLCVRNVAESALLTAAADFEVLHFDGPVPEEHAGSAELDVTRDGLFDGCLLWTVVTAGAGQTVDYFREQRAWLPVFLPLGDVPLPVRRGDRLRLRWRCHLDSDPRFPDYTVTVQLPGPDGPVERSHTTRHRSTVAGGTLLHRQLLQQMQEAAAPLSVTALRHWLDARVPGHLVPQSWVFLPDLPLGPGGKLDRDALPAPGGARPRLAGPCVPAQSAAERGLAALWSEVLGLETVGITDDFFELGGDSITAVQLTTAIQRWLDAAVPLAALFDAPTIAGLAGYLEKHHGDSLTAALGPERNRVPAARPVVERGAASRVPLTFMQQSLWFLHSLYPGETSASEQFAVRLTGLLDRQALVRAWADVLARHPVLNVTFSVDGDRVWQAPGATVAPPFTDLDLRGDETRLVAVAEQALQQRFDLSAGPPVRAVLCRLRVDSHVLLVTAHHIVADGLSVPVLQADLARAYAAAQVPAHSAPDYAALAARADWQRGNDAPEALEWWRAKLADPPPPALDELVRPAPGRRLSRRAPLILEVRLAARVREFARASSATPFMLLLAAFRTLLMRLTGKQDVLIGTPMTLRDSRELRDVVGCFVNPVVLRTPVDPSRSFGAHLQAERASLLEALPYRRVPFARVVEAVTPARELGVHPLFRILFSYEQASAAVPGAAGLDFELTSIPATRASYFDLECSLQDTGENGSMTGYIAWSSTVLEDAVAEMLPTLFRTLLDDALTRPDAPVGRLALLTSAEQRRMLVEWNATAAPVPAEPTLHAWFLAQAARTPHAPAIRTEAGAWTYGELAARSAQLALRLVQSGVTPGTPVGLALGRSPELVLGLLAVLRAGGIVVPLDPGYPLTRLRGMARDAGLGLLLMQRSVLPPEIADALAADGLPLLDLSPDADAGLDVDAVLALPTPATVAPAFILYTSGSTGTPKGAVTTHQSALNRCAWMWRAFGFGADEVFALRTSLNFIDAWWEIFGALGHGIPLEVVPDALATDPLQLPAFLAQRGITQLVLVPSLLRALLDALPETGTPLPRLRWCITSGEPLEPELVARCQLLLPRMAVLNTYGTSEIWDATAFDTRHLDRAAVRVPIGRPIANTRVYVMDAAGEPLPVGIPGELRVAGVGVGAGYWRRPALTAEKFVRSTLPGVAGETLYRTGDRARFLADGSVECLGRLDAQLKLRGQRIEPAEIEQALALHPTITSAVVGLAGEGNDALLVAGVVLADDGMSDTDALVAAWREHLRAQLPAHLVPGAWRVLRELPRTPSGKLDRRSWFADVESRLPARGGEHVPPRNAVERELAGLWSTVLGGIEVGMYDNFFELGGHSLLAARLLTRIRTAFGVPLQLRALFEAPTVAGLAAHIECVREQASASVLPALSAPTAAPVVEPELSFGQERLWFLEQLDPGNAAYNVAWTIRCDGPLQVDALRGALDGLVARHGALRTCFLESAGRPVVVVNPPAPLPLPVHDLTGASGEALQEALTTLARAPFDLATGPLLRTTLVRVTEIEQHLLIVAHHAITDATSNQLLFAELGMAYEAIVRGESPAWLPLPLEYAAFARHQRERQAAPDSRAELDWWRQRLAGAPPALELPTDRPRPAEQRFAGAWVRRAVPAAVLERLTLLATARNCTLYMLLLAVFKAQLSRYSGATDVLVGTPVEGRLTPEAENLVGLCINTLVLRTDLGGDPSFGELLDRVRNTTLDAQAHQEVPFEQLVEALAPERSLSRSPVFQVLFNLLRLPARRRRIGDLTLRMDRLLDQGVSSFDLTLTATVDPDGLALIFEYATDLFDAATVEQMADCYLTLLHSAVADPATPLSRLPLLSAVECAQLLALGAGPEPDAKHTSVPVHAVVAANAIRWPDAAAVALGDEVVSYAELDARANRLAWALQVRGAGRGVRVGVCLPRTPDYLVAVLATLKTGAAFVPLDPDYPPARLAGMAADAALAFVIVNPSTRSLVPGSAVLDLERDAESPGSNGASFPVVNGAPGDPAYVLFTSGSTGRPKGVVVSHASLANALAGWRSVYELQPGESHLQMASAAFDVFTGDWVRALGTGGRLVLCPKDVLLDPPALLAALRAGQMRVAEFVPAVLRLLLEHVAAINATLPRLRLLIVGSDVWYGSELEALRRLCTPDTRIFNSYGVAEATIDSTWHEADAATLTGPVPIGRPFPGVTVSVRDERGELLPRGLPGELCIGGAGLALGYFGQPERTAERFVTTTAQGGARLYRTGDRARWNNAGQLELLGRADAQFKLRGFRIEPGEIEACLTALPGVVAAAVGLVSAPGGGQLVAWLVASPAPARPATDGLQRLLRQQLPEQMVPTRFVWLPELPLTPNGKVDRAALVAGAAVGAASTAILFSPGAGIAAEAAPATPVEARLCALMAAVLGVPAVGPDDDFFRSGGHSLLATRLVAHIRDAFRSELPLRAIFETPSARGLAAALSSAAVARLLRKRERSGEAVPLSAMQQRLWFLERLHPGSAVWHLHWLARLRGPLDRQALQAAVDTLVARHETLRTRFGEQSGIPYQEILPTVHIAVTTVSASHAPPIEALIAVPFDLGTGPLLRLSLLERGPDDQRLLVVMHHLIADGWSVGVFSRELAAVYNGIRRGVPAVLPELPLQYADYAFWQQERLESAVLDDQLAFWRERLAGAAPLLALPADRPRPPAPEARGSWVERCVPSATRAALQALAQAEGATLFMLLLAAFKVLVGRLAGTDDVLVGTPVAGRSHTALEGLIGFFVNTLVLRTGLGGDPTFRDILVRVRSTTVDAFSHADLPFEKLVEMLQPRRSLAHSPLVQVLFALHNQPRQPLALDALSVTPETVAGEAVKFDLSVHIAEEGDALQIALAGRTDLFETGTLQNFADQFVALIEAIALRPDTRISALLPGVPGISRAIAVTPAEASPPELIAGAPPTATEQSLLELWQQLLGHVTFHRDTDFFAAGGHSLLAMRLIAGIAGRLGVELPLISVFEAPTVRALARRVVAARPRAQRPGTIPRLPRRPARGEQP